MKRVIFGIIAVVAFSALVVVGLYREVDIYEEDLSKDDIVLYEPIPEVALVIDATFSGVMKSKLTGRLFSTYVRGQDIGRKACPT